MTPKTYIRAVLRKTAFDAKTKKRIAADLEGDISAQLAQSLQSSMPSEVAVRKSPWRWVFLALVALLLLGIVYSAITWAVVGPDMLAAAEENLAMLRQQPGTYAAEITAYGVGLPYFSALGLALGALGAFLLMQWKGSERRQPARYLALGLMLLFYALFMWVGGLSGCIIEGFLPVQSTPAILLSRLVNPAFLAPLAAGVAALRLYLRHRRGSAQPA